MRGWQEGQHKTREEGSVVVKQEVRCTVHLLCAQSCEEALEIGLVPVPQDLPVRGGMKQPL